MGKIDQRPGKYVGELRRIFNCLEQWNGKEWCEPPERATYEAHSGKIHFDVEDALHD
jgi:hypothetical protein